MSSRSSIDEFKQLLTQRSVARAERDAKQRLLNNLHGDINRLAKQLLNERARQSFVVEQQQQQQQTKRQRTN